MSKHNSESSNATQRKRVSRQRRQEQTKALGWETPDLMVTDILNALSGKPRGYMLGAHKCQRCGEETVTAFRYMTNGYIVLRPLCDKCFGEITIIST